MAAEWRGWTTSKEKEYILQACEKREFGDQLDFLRKYRVASRNRIDWQDMDQEELLAFVNRLIVRIGSGKGLPAPIPVRTQIPPLGAGCPESLAGDSIDGDTFDWFIADSPDDH